MNRIEAIERSVRCLTLGLIGLVPIIGLPTALVAISEFHQVRKHYRGCWNPARRYLVCGAIFAYTSTGVVLLTAAWMISRLAWRWFLDSL